MKNSIDVYWAWGMKSRRGKGLNETFPTPLFSSLKSMLPKNESTIDYLKCPAAQKELKNTFILKSHIKPFIFGYKNNKFGYQYSAIPTSPDETNLAIHRNPAVKDSIIDFPWQIYFYSPTSLEMTLSPAFLSRNEFVQNTTILPGRYNISTWFRPLLASFFMNTDLINVFKDDDIFYIKFHTDKKINFINFDMTPKLELIAEDLVRYKFFYSNTPFKKLYELFLNKKYHKRILKEIKANLTGY